MHSKTIEKKPRDTDVLSQGAPESDNIDVLFHLFSYQV